MSVSMPTQSETAAFCPSGTVNAAVFYRHLQPEDAEPILHLVTIIPKGGQSDPLPFTAA